MTSASDDKMKIVAAAESRLSEFRVPSVPLDQYERLLSVTQTLMAALRQVTQHASQASSAADDTVDTIKNIALEALQKVEQQGSSSSSGAAAGPQPHLSSASSVISTSSASRVVAPPPATTQKQPAIITAADGATPASTKKQQSAAADSKAANRYDQNSHHRRHPHRHDDTTRSDDASPPPAEEASSSTADGAVGSGVGGTSATVRESIVEGGKLVKLVSDAHPLPGKLWSLQNTTSNVQFIVTFTFGQHSQVEPLGDTIMVPLASDSSTSHRGHHHHHYYHDRNSSSSRSVSAGGGGGGVGDAGGGGGGGGGGRVAYRISLYPTETKAFVRGVFSGYRMSLKFGPPDSGFVAAVRTQGGASQSVLERLEEIRAENGGYIALDVALSTCLEAGSSFIDVEFPPTAESACRAEFEHDLLVPMRWERPERFLPLGEKAELAAAFDAQSLMWTIPHSTAEAGLRTSWLVSGCAVLASCPATVRYVLAALRRCTLSDSTSGLYRVELCHGGIWRNVVVDSLMPCHRETRECIGAQCASDKRDMWGAVVEKAFAKSCGSYAALQSGGSGGSGGGHFDPLETMMDLTGGYVERFDWRAREVAVFAALQGAITYEKERTVHDLALVAVLLSNMPVGVSFSSSSGLSSSSSAPHSVVPSRSASTQRGRSASPSTASSSMFQQAMLETSNNINNSSMNNSRSHSPAAQRTASVATNATNATLDPQHQQQEQQQQQAHANYSDSNNFLIHLGLRPGHAYRVVATATADSVRMVLIDSIHDVDVVPPHTHVVEEIPDPLPLRGLGSWASDKQWDEHPNIAAACRQALRNTVLLAARPRHQWSSGETAMLKYRLVWMDWRDAVFAFDGAGTLMVPPELSLYSPSPPPPPPPPSAPAKNTHTERVDENGEEEGDDKKKKEQSSQQHQQQQQQQQQHQNNNTHHYQHLSASASSSSSSAPTPSVPRNVLLTTTLDIRMPNAFTAATPDWMLELQIRVPTTLYIGLHQRDKRGLDPLHPDRHYSALLLSVIGCAASGVWDAVSHSHNGTYWRGRDVQVEVKLEPRTKPYYILPRRYASSSETASSIILNNTSSSAMSATANSAASTSGKSGPSTRKEVVLSLIVPDGQTKLSPSDFVFRKPTADVMRAVRYSPVWRFDPTQCVMQEFNEYARSLYCCDDDTSAGRGGGDNSGDNDNTAQQGLNISSSNAPSPDPVHHHKNNTSGSESNPQQHYFFRLLRQSRSIDVKASAAADADGGADTKQATTTATTAQLITTPAIIVNRVARDQWSLEW